MRRFTIARWLRRGPMAWVLLAGAMALPGPCPCGPAIAGDIIPADRRIDWSPGIPGGIPTYPVGINVKDAPYSAKGDGVADDTAAIQAAIRACPAGKAVFLPAGTYRTTSELQSKAKGSSFAAPGRHRRASVATRPTARSSPSTIGATLEDVRWSAGFRRVPRP